MASAARQHWAGLDHERHLLLVDAALDDNDVAHDALRRELKDAVQAITTEMKTGFTDCADRDKRTRTLLVSLLVSLVVASFIIVTTVLTQGAT